MSRMCWVAALIAGLIPKRVARFHRHLHSALHKVHRIRVTETVVVETGKTDLIRRGDNAVGAGDEEVSMHVAHSVRFVDQDAGRPEVVVEHMASHLKRGRQSPIKHHDTLVSNKGVNWILVIRSVSHAL